jgi:hypothetical protein
MSKIKASTQFINVMVKVVPGTKPGQFDVHTAPETPWVTQPDTIINYQIYNTDHNKIVFTGMTAAPNDQLSAAVVSVSGKQLTFSDANTSAESISFTLQFKDENGVAFSHDPQVQNEPRP